MTTTTPSRNLIRKLAFDVIAPTQEKLYGNIQDLRDLLDSGLTEGVQYKFYRPGAHQWADSWATAILVDMTWAGRVEYYITIESDRGTLNHLVTKYKCHNFSGSDEFIQAEGGATGWHFWINVAL